MLDTNTVSHLLRQHSTVARSVVSASMAALCISAITDDELLFGLAKQPAARRVHLAVREFLRRVDALPWDSTVAERYGAARVDMERQGNALGRLNVLIAPHALAAGAVLVTNDRAFGHMANLPV